MTAHRNLNLMEEHDLFCRDSNDIEAGKVYGGAAVGEPFRRRHS
jgi:hypothetical protein